MGILSHGPQAPGLKVGADPEVARLRSKLMGFELGCFLLENLGLNGHWTSYVLMCTRTVGDRRTSAATGPR